MEIDPLVSVCVITYNHEKYVRESLDGIISQKTNFPFEIIVCDDASTDNTVKIVREKYAERVRMNVHTENLGICRNMYDACKLAKGKYIAFLAGDDFVLTKDYLQIHYDFMENHSEFVGVSHGMKIVDDEGKEQGLVLSKAKKRTLYDYLWCDIPGIPYDVFLKNIFTDEHLEWLYFAARDNDEISFQFWIYLHGSIAILPKYLHAYRAVKKDGGSNYNSLFDATDTYWIADKACQYIEREVSDEYRFKYIMGSYAATTAKIVIMHIIKNRDIQYLKKWIKKCGWHPFFRGIILTPLFLLGHGNYPEWYRKIHFLKNRHCKTRY